MVKELNIRYEKAPLKQYIFPVGNFIYELTGIGDPSPGNVMKKFTANQVGFSRGYQMPIFRANSKTNLFYGKERRLLQGSTFLAYRPI